MMKRAYLVVRSFFVRNYEAIKLGLLGAIFVTTIMMLNNQTRTLQEVLNVNEQIKIVLQNDTIAREDAIEQSRSRDEVIIRYLECIALIRPENRTPENIRACVDSARVDISGSVQTPAEVTPAQPVITPQQATPPPRQEPTTSEPPEPEQTGLVNSITDTVRDTVKNTLDTVLSVL